MSKPGQTATRPRRAAPSPTHATLGERWHWLLVPALLVLTGVLAVTSSVGDSVTFDETAHLTAGMSYLETGDFRLSPEHPPLGRIWAAWPLLLVDHHWPPSDSTHWRDADVFGVGRDWLFRLNDGQRLVVIARCMMVILLLATCLTIYALARMLFGPPAGLLALTLAALSPTLLAHGRLVTTDLPITLCAALTLLTFARLMQRVTWLRLLAAALALTATSLSKFSWPLVVPALVVMTVIAIFRRQPLEVAAGSRPAGNGARPQPPRTLNDRARSRANPAIEGPRGLKPAALHCRTIAHGHLARRRDRAAILLGSALCVGLVVWLGIWTCYGWRISVVAPLTGGEDTPRARAQLEHTIERIALDWERSLNYPHAPLRPVLPGLLRLTADTGLMPDGYLLGLALMMLYSGPRSAFLLGAYSNTGWLSYFPLAFCMKTPLATLLLLVAGLLALRRALARSRDTVLLAGLIVFAAVYAGFVINGRLNIGVRHLMPVYPVVFVFAGASAAWVSTRAGRWLVGGAVVWLLAVNLWTRPHYLAYFNELSGGPGRGHLRLADSNIDWGQDLLRLADYARQHPDESIKLAYFGSAIPTHYLRCTALPSFQGFSPRAELTAGTYVVSVTQLLGVWDRELRPAFWNARRRQAYETLGQMAAAPPGEDDTPEQHARRAEAAKEYGELRYKRLLSRLGFNGQRERQPDDRIGYSLFVYHLTDADIERLTRP